MELQIVDVDAFQVKSTYERNYVDWQTRLNLNALNLEQESHYAMLEPHVSDPAAAFIVRLWCRSVQGDSICIVVCDAARHVYRQLRSECLRPSFKDRLVQATRDVLFEKTKGMARSEIVHKFTTNGWRCEPSAPNAAKRLAWLKVTATNAWQVRGASTAGKDWMDEVAARTRKPLYDVFSHETAHLKLDVRTEVLQTIGVRAGGWLRLPSELHAKVLRGSDVSLLHCGGVLQVKMAELAGTALPDKVAMAPLRVLSFDIECVSHTDSFPNPEQPEDRVICIGLYCKVLGAPESSSTCTMLCLGETAELPADVAANTRVLSYKSEVELLKAFKLELCRLDVDVVAGYNTSLFDWRYLAKRSQLLREGVSCVPQQYSRYLVLETPPKEQSLSSGALGDNPLCYPRMPGRVNFDLWLHLKRENISGLENLKLNTISKHFLNDEKHDLDAKEMFRAYRQGPQGRARVALYCRQDCKLVLDLIEKLEALPSVWEMAKVTCTSPEDILYRGQQIKVYTQLVLKALECDYLVEDRLETSDVDQADESFQGATVVTPTPGYYIEPIFCLDFASLYPSLMRTKNLSPECLIPSSLFQGADRDAERPLSNDIQVRDGVVHHFIRSSVHEGLLPRILEQLLSERKRVKKLMQREADPRTVALLNSKQLALKISANSVYGACGALKGKLSCRECAEATTAAGREAIEFTCAYVNRREGFQIIYGDTDSAFARVPKEYRSLSMEQLFEHGEALAEEVTHAIAQLMPSEKCHIRLEFEKIFYPLILYKKKRYAGLCVEHPATPAKIVAKGLELVRRDACQLVKEAQRRVIQLLLQQQDARAATEEMLAALRSILAIPIGGPFSSIKQSKSLRANYHDEKSQAHCVVRSLMRQRELGSEPQVGDRVEFVVIASRCDRVVDKCEDVAFAEQNRLPPDWAHYLDALERPLRAILEVPLENSRPDLMEKLLRECESMKQTAKALVARHCMARHGATWMHGHLLKGGAVQMKLFPCPALRDAEAPPSAAGQAVSVADRQDPLPTAQPKRTGLLPPQQAAKKPKKDIGTNGTLPILTKLSNFFPTARPRQAGTSAD